MFLKIRTSDGINLKLLRHIFQVSWIRHACLIFAITKFSKEYDIIKMKVNWSFLYGSTKNSCSKVFLKDYRYCWGNTNCWSNGRESTRNYVAHVDGKQIYMNLLNLKFPFEIRKISFICKSTRLKQNRFNKLTFPSKPLNRPIKQYTLALYHVHVHKAGLRRWRPNAILCKTCSVLLCVLEQPRVDNSSVGPNAVLCKACSVLLCVLEQPRVDNSGSVGPERE